MVYEPPQNEYTSPEGRALYRYLYRLTEQLNVAAGQTDGSGTDTAALQSSLHSLKGRVSLLTERMDAGGSDLSTRLDALQAQADRLDAGLTGQAALVQALRDRADTLNAALQALTERVEALEQASSEP